MTDNKKTNNKKEFQSKNITFTFKLCDKHPISKERLQNFARTNCDFMCFAKETGEGGMQHYQGYMILKDKKRPSTVRNQIFPEKELQDLFHTESARKCKLANFRYCSKEGSAWVYDFYSNFEGMVNKNEQKNVQIKATKSRIDSSPIYKTCIDLAKQGKYEEILEKYPRVYLQYKEKLESIRVDSTTKERMFLDNEFGNFFKCHFLWLWGPTGMGKSYFCTVLPQLLNRFYECLYKNRNKKCKPLTVYYKNKNKWWDRYNNEDIIIIEEASPETMRTSAHYYKQWIDEYPFNPEVKGSTLNYIRPKFIVITSNYSLDDCFWDEKHNRTRDEDYLPLSRRLC